MKIRRYLANNTQEAILKVKMDLGSDALILNTRKVRKKGFLGLFSKPMVEVLAAVDEYGTSQKQQETTKKDAKSQFAVEPMREKTIFNEKEEKIATLENKVSGMESILQKIYKQLNSQTPAIESQEKEQEIKKEKVIIKKPQAYSKTVQIFYNNMLKSEVEPELAKRIADMASTRMGVSDSINETASIFYNIVSGILGKPETIKLRDDGKPTVVVFVGPTGVGKTTTLAKVAANYALNHKKKVGFITADTYRIAAVEQLKTYAEILGIPVGVTYSPSDLIEAIDNYSDKDLILIDTAGRSHKNKAQFEELKSLVIASDADEIFLLMSATTSVRNCKEILSYYDFLKSYKLIFTKIDEAPALGIVLNARSMTGKNLAYMTIGQSVPDDIEVANIDKITKNLLGSLT